MSLWIYGVDGLKILQVKQLKIWEKTDISTKQFYN